MSEKFSLDDKAVEKYYDIESPFDGNILGWFVYQRTYSRIKSDGYNENWIETVRRVVEGTYNMQKKHVDANGLGWDRDKGQKSAQEMFDRIFHMKFTPPGRGLWAMGTKITEEKGLYTALNNCAFISAENIDTIVNGKCEYEPSRPFRFLMDVSMLGVGCGFDVKGAGKVYVRKPRKYSGYSADDADKINDNINDNNNTKILNKYTEFIGKSIAEIREKMLTVDNDFVKYGYEQSIAEYESELKAVNGLDPRGINTYTIEDTREGWVKSCGLLIDSYIKPDEYPYVFDYSQIRPPGIPLNTFGGYSSGPGPLFDLHLGIKKVLNKNAGDKLTQTTIVDIMNMMGKCVVAGNIRRTAEIALGPLDSDEFVDLKNYDKNPERVSYGWCSNNSVMAEIGMDYSGITERIKNNGEPGIFWLNNAREYSRMNGFKDYKDMRATGTNPSLRAGTNIYTDNGIFPIEKLQDQEFYLTNLNGEKSKAKCFLSGKNKRLWKITITGGHEYYATAEHEWPIFRKAHLLGVVPWGYLLDKKYRTDQLKTGMRLRRRGKNNSFCDYIRHYSDESVIRTREKVIDMLKNIAKCTEDDKKFITDMLGFWGINCYIFKNALFVSGNSDKKMYADSGIREISRNIDRSLDEYEDYAEIISVHETDLYEDVWDITVYDNTHCFQLAHCITGNCSEQTLESAEMCCVSADTRIQTLDGCPKIADVVGQEVSVWNGIGWSKVTPFIAGYNKKLYRVHLSDGTHLDCTGDHKWSIRDYSCISNQVDSSEYTISPGYKQLETTQLIQGHEVEMFSLAESFGNNAKSNATVGFGYSAEGFIDYIGEETFTANPFYIMEMLTCGNPMHHFSDPSANLPVDMNVECANNLITDFAMLMRRCGYNSVKIAQKYHDHSRIEFAKHPTTQTITAIEELPGLHATYCFTEPARHMGVFGNVLTYQCLVEVFPTRHETKEDFLRTLKFAYLYAKTVTLGQSHWPETNRVMMRNRRIGCSLSGIAEFIDNRGLETFRDWISSGYDVIQYWDKVYSEYLAVPRSIKTTSVKPSGCLTPDTVVRLTDKSGSLDYSITLEHLFDLNGYELRICKTHTTDGMKCESSCETYTDKYPEGTWLPLNGDYYVFNRYGNPEMITELYIQGKTECLMIPLEGGREIKCTPNHKFLVRENPECEPIWKMAKDLVVGDDLVEL